MSLHQVFGRLQTAGFKCEVKRHIYYQPVRLGTTLEIAEKRPGLLGTLENLVFQRGLARLKLAVEEHGANHRLGSEVALAEVWAQKVVKVPKGKEA